MEQFCSSALQTCTGQLYEYAVDPIDIQSGDILGIFGPNDVRLQLYYTDQYGPLNYSNYDRTGNAVTPPPGDVDSSSTDLDLSNDMPLVTVEISKLVQSHECIITALTTALLATL